MNAIDAKARVSLPIGFRLAIDRRLQAAGQTPSDDTRQILVAEHKTLPCLTAYDRAYEAKLLDAIDEEVGELKGLEKLARREALHSEYLPAARPVSYDSAGRMSLPQLFRKQVGIEDLAYFVTSGESFQIWSPEVYRETNKDRPWLVRALDSHLPERER